MEYDLNWAYYTSAHGRNQWNGQRFSNCSTGRSEFYDLPVRFPPLPEQKAIAHILGTLDDKIELNRRMNQTLEAMARAMFKSWFVDFDPVRAKMNGEDYPLDAETWPCSPTGS